MLRGSIANFGPYHRPMLMRRWSRDNCYEKALMELGDDDDDDDDEGGREHDLQKITVHCIDKDLGLQLFNIMLRI